MRRHVLPFLGVILLLVLLLWSKSCDAGKKTMKSSKVGKLFWGPPRLGDSNKVQVTTTRRTSTTTSEEVDDDGASAVRGCRCSDGSQGCFCVNTFSCQQAADFLPKSDVPWRESQCLRDDLCCPLHRDVEADDSGALDQCGLQLQPDELSHSAAATPDAKPGQAKFGEAPWMALLLISKLHGGEDQWTPLCGGSLVTMSVVLTAAHCIVGVEFEQMEVRVGEWDYQAPTEDLIPQTRLLLAVKVHEHYKEASLVNDVALVFVDAKFVRTPNVRPVCLPTPEVRVDRGCFATGWGRNRYGLLGNVSTVMHKADLELLKRDDCELKLRKTRLGQYFTLNSNFVCALGSRNHEDVCQGDGGGPLVCPLVSQQGKGGAKRYVQMGVVSWGIDCGLKDVPGVYVDLRKYSHWIRSQLQFSDGPVPTFYGES